MRNIVLVDFDADEDWSFCNYLNKRCEDWHVIKKVTNHLHGSRLSNILRFAWYFLFPFSIVLRRKQYDKIICWQQFFGLNYAFWCNLFRLKKVNDLTVMTFIYKRKNGMVGKIYSAYMNYVVSSPYIDRFICFSQAECDYYSSLFGLRKEKFVFVPLGVPDQSDLTIGDGKYIFSSGRSNRDYDFLIDSLKDSSFHVVIASDTYQRADKMGNIKLLHDCYGQEMMKLMANSRCVVVPLDDLKMSSGQLVVLQAMSLGKPVICTKSDGIKDYVQEGKTGFLIENDKVQLLSVLHKLFEDQPLYEEICANARTVYQDCFTEEAMLERIADCVVS